MRNALAIARKELSIYFSTPWAYVIFTGMVGISAFFFLGNIANFKDAQMYARIYGWARIPPELKNLTDGVIVPLWDVIAVIVIFAGPFLSMRLFAEEKRNRTFELLMTAPVRPWEIVLGKYLGGVGIISATLALTLIFPLTLSLFGASESGSALEWRTVGLGFAGLLLWGATAMAVVMFLSSLTESQALAAFLTFIVLLAWFVLRYLAPGAEEPWRGVINYLSFGGQLSTLFRGVLELKALVFFGSVIALSFLLTHRTVELQRWA